MTEFLQAIAASWGLIVQADPALLAIVGRSLAVSGLACALAWWQTLATQRAIACRAWCKRASP